MTAKETVLRFRASEKEKALIEEAAKLRGHSLSSYVRSIAVEQARNDLNTFADRLGPLLEDIRTSTIARKIVKRVIAKERAGR
jgi:hypothetical protein